MGRVLYVYILVMNVMFMNFIVASRLCGEMGIRVKDFELR